MTHVVGLTGGIGSGKSVCAQFFADLGVLVIDADQIARECVKPATAAYPKIVKHFGSQILQPNGELDRSMLREIIFSQPTQKVWLEQLLHPLIHQAILEKVRQTSCVYCIVSVPLLAEHYEQYKDLMDHIISIEAPPDQQLAWLIQRDHCDEDLAKKIIASQATDKKRRQTAQTILLNHGNLVDLNDKVKALHAQFLAQWNSR